MCSLKQILITQIWMAALIGVSLSDVYTSSSKIEDMVLKEETILNNLHTAVSSLENESTLSYFSRFYNQRMPVAKERMKDLKLREILKHPNGIYHNIKQFASDYQDIRSFLESANANNIANHLSTVASHRDVEGARRSFLRLQDVYSLTLTEMTKGNFLGFPGPELNDVDALQIGLTAFNNGYLNSSVAWLLQALEMTKRREPTAGFLYNEAPVELTGEILTLLGRVYVRQGRDMEAREMLRKAKNIDPTNPHVKQLEAELISRPAPQSIEARDSDFCRLCALESYQGWSQFDNRLKCRYRKYKLPYYRFKVELVSVSPYVVLFYEVITDAESQYIIDFNKHRLERGFIEVEGQPVKKETRTSDLSFVYDKESPILARLSRRVGFVTYLDAKEYDFGSSYAGEPFQIVNYGMGGHYAVHHDAFDEYSQKSERYANVMKYGGNRLATFLIYLTDVDRGGSTVFTKADLAVRPIKKMALFWYSFKPSGELDSDTLHAACPVVVGHKWVTNKWIWVHGNAFTRRCGLTEDATQLDIDKYMRRGWA